MGVGGVAGVLARYGLTIWMPQIWTVVAINIAGSFLLGVMMPIGTHLLTGVRDGVAIGFLGGFTTFSTFTVQVVLEVDGGHPGRAAAYFLLSVIAGVVAAAAGYAVGSAVA